MRFVLMSLAALGMPLDVQAQVAGTISGYVRDESGAVVPGADVKATMIGQQLTRSAVTDETGFLQPARDAERHLRNHRAADRASRPSRRRPS